MLNAAKMVIKEKKYVRNKKDNFILLSEDGKLQEALCDAYCGAAFGSTDFDVLDNVREAALWMTYYWYNFMPLSRGSAAVGFVV
ncbi:hypothetical protein ACH5RR_011507 [Cinchona calisaya]|uniref:Uncharacterized protein n=1 Tax=Cinchona calisaya TaxID=153742 RepID=A0ABD3A527_9GENT